MRIDSIDDGFVSKGEKKDLSFIFVIIFIILIVFLLLSSLFFSNLIMRGDNSYNIDIHGQRYGKSAFIKYLDKIYVPIPSGGMYALENADINTFKPLDSEDYYSRIIGLDKNNVYFGNIPISDLNPATLHSIGNGYYSDGTNTYFCSFNSEKNKKLSATREVVETLMSIFSKTSKPQTYIYPYRKIEDNRKLKAIENLFYFATDGEKVYYKGEILENADLNTLKKIDGNNEYFFDKENVYYKTQLLPIKNTGKLKVISSEQGDEFLYDEKNGYVFIENYSFNKEKAPYKVVGTKGNHLYNLIFIAKDGVYYYNNQKKKQERAGDNIFIGEIKELSPNIFSDDENIYYFHAYEVWHSLKGGGRVLSSRNTLIYCLGKKIGWEKVTDIGNGIVGSIWKKGGDYYYFDNEGIFQSINDTIYKIIDRETLEYLMNIDEANPDKIRKLIENKKLTAVSGEEKIKITIKHQDRFRRAMIYLEIFIIFIALIVVFFKKYRKK